MAVKCSECIVHYLIARVLPGCVEPCVNGAIRALRRRGIIGSGIRDVLLRHRGKIRNRVRDAVCSSESEDDTLRRRRVRQSDVAAGVREQWPGVPCFDELEALEVFAARDAAEGLLNAEAEVPDAIGDIHYTGEFFEVREEVRWDGVIVGRMLFVEGSLLFWATKDWEEEGREGEKERAK